MRNRIYLVTLAVLIMAAPAAARQSEDDPFTRGNRAFRLGQYEMAIFEYRQALNQMDERYGETNYNLDACAYALGRKREAAAWFRRALKAQHGHSAIAAYAIGWDQVDMQPR